MEVTEKVSAQYLQIYVGKVKKVLKHGYEYRKVFCRNTLLTDIGYYFKFICIPNSHSGHLDVTYTVTVDSSTLIFCLHVNK